MARARDEGRLVKVDQLPRRTRRSKYGKAIEEFVESGWAYARYESSGKPEQVASALRAAARARGAAVKVTVVAGEVYLAKQ